MDRSLRPGPADKERLEYLRNRTPRPAGVASALGHERSFDHLIGAEEDRVAGADSQIRARDAVSGLMASTVL